MSSFLLQYKKYLKFERPKKVPETGHFYKNKIPAPLKPGFYVS
jgi:hypothetical protein